jgi:hypothetical protein
MADAVEHLNALAADRVKDHAPMRTTEEVLRFLKNPPQRAYSLPLEEAMTAVVRMFKMADENGRRVITARLSKDARNGFLGYAADMAVLGVRRQSPALIEQGLVALVIEGASQDFRDSVVALAKLYHSAVKLGMEAAEAFEQAAGQADEGIIKREMSGFPFRAPQERDLKAFFETEEGTGEDFRYRQVPWSLPKK